MHNGCVLCGGVGVGKSHTAVGYYLENEAPKPVYVITTAKKRDKHDWQFLWSEVGMTYDPDLTMGATVKVDSWENIAKYEEITDAFFIFDEQRLVGTGRWVKAFYKIAKANRWIMLSATPGDNWLDYVPLFRANGFIKNLTQFKEDHVVSRWTGRYYQVTGYRQVGRLIRWRNQILVDMPYEKHTTRHTHEVAVEYDKELVKELVKKRWHVYENRPLTDASELFRVMRKVVYSDQSRIQAVRSLLDSHPKLIVFYNFDYELEILRTLNIPQTQIMKAPEQIVPLGPSRPSSQSSSSDLTTQSSTSSPTDQTSQANSSNPWDYLLSPEGMMANAGSTSKTRSINSKPLSVSSLRDGSETGSNTMDEERNSFRGDEIAVGGSPETDRTLRTNTDTAGSSTTSTTGSIDPPAPSAEPTDPSKRWETATGIPTDHPNAPWTETWTQSSSGLGRTPGASSKTRRPGQSTTGSFTGSSDSPSSLQTSNEGLSKSSNENEEMTEWTKKFLLATSKASTSFESPTDTSSDKSGIEKSDGSLNSSTGETSSTQSSQSPDLSSSGRSSTQSPQFQVAEWNGHKHEDVPTSTSWVYLVQYVAGAEAWECVETDAICFYSMPYSYKKWDQAHGRIDRLHTSFLDLHYYVLISDAVIDRGVAKSLASQKSFNEAAFSREMGFNT